MFTSLVTFAHRLSKIGNLRFFLGCVLSVLLFFLRLAVAAEGLAGCCPRVLLVERDGGSWGSALQCGVPTTILF